MKQKITLCLLTVASTALLTGCSCNKKDEKTTKTTIEVKGKTDVAIQRTDSGLGYETIEAGSGNTPEPGKTVTVHYTGWLDDNGMPGNKFDSSVDRGQPFAFKIGIGYVIPGWDEGVMDMKIGEKRRLYIPSKLGYGEHGAGAAIPPNSDLIFDVELLEVE